MPVEERLWKKVNKTKTCWLWTAALDTDGYGQFSVRGSPRKGAHKVVYELLKREVPVGMTLDHLCMIRNCVNPEHLEIVTIKINLLRGNGIPARNARKKLCKRGHIFTGTLQKQNARYCKTCKKLNYQKLKNKNQEL